MLLPILVSLILSQSFSAALFKLWGTFLAAFTVFLVVVPIFLAWLTAIKLIAIPAPKDVLLLESENPNIFLTTSSACLINIKDKITKTDVTTKFMSVPTIKFAPIVFARVPAIYASLPPNVLDVSKYGSNNLYDVFVKAKYIMQWNGCIKIVYKNSFNHFSNACAFWSFILSIEYVIEINGDIIIKKATLITRLIYATKNAIDIKTIPQNTIVAVILGIPEPTVASKAILLYISLMLWTSITPAESASRVLIKALLI